MDVDVDKPRYHRQMPEVNGFRRQLVGRERADIEDQASFPVNSNQLVWDKLEEVWVEQLSC
jgi:hypothetical protein